MGLQGRSLAPVCDAPQRDSTPLRTPRGRQKQPSPTGLTVSGARLQVGPPSAFWFHVRDRAAWLPAPCMWKSSPLPALLSRPRQARERGFGGKSSTKLHENGVWPGFGPRCWERRASRLGCAGPAERKCALRDHTEGPKGGGRGSRAGSSERQRGRARPLLGLRPQCSGGRLRSSQQPKRLGACPGRPRFPVCGCTCGMAGSRERDAGGRVRGPVPRKALAEPPAS